MTVPETNQAHYQSEPAGDLIGIELLEVRPGFAQARLDIQAKHLNGHGTAHGGIIFMLADTVFAYACNSRGVKTVGAKCDIIYHLPTVEGNTLTATGQEHYLKGRSGIYDIVVKNQDDQIIAHFRGHSMALKTH